jgi:type I restriction enzyme S subunit
MPRGSKDQVLDFLIPDFELSDQQKIASVLSVLDAKIELNNQINSELEKMAKTLYDYWFVQFDFPNENGKPYKSSGGPMVWNQELKREIPDGWMDYSLWEIAKYYNGLAMQKNRPTSDDYLPVIKIKEMNEGFSEKTEKARADIPAEAIVNDGDVLFSWSATLDVKIWSGGKGALNQHIFKVTSNKYPKTFYYFELRNYLEHFKMMADNRKTTMGHITQDHLRQSRISIPPIEIIKKLDSIIEPPLTKQVALHQENQKLIQLRDWLLPMLMNGQVSVK